MLLLPLLWTSLALAAPEPAGPDAETDEDAESIAGPRPLLEDGLPETGLDYRIEATIEPSTGALSGIVKLEWTYPGDTPLTEVPVHLYLNGFSGIHSTWSESSSALRSFSLEDKADTWEDPWGHSDLVEVKQDGAECSTRFVQPDDANPDDRSLAMVTLAQPIEPGATLSLELTFDARLPTPIARTGCHAVRQYCHVAQWFPKLAYFDTEARFGAQGFVAQQFHGPTEFFAPFADYRVQIDAPTGFDVVATGRSVEESEADGRQQVVFAQRAVHDFAFVLAPELVIDQTTHQPAGGGPEVLLTMVTQPETPDRVGPMREATSLSLDILSSQVGPFAWSSMTVIEPPMAAAQTAGMEYQTLITGMPGDPLLAGPPLASFELGMVTIAHEVAHNWFQGMIATNEVQDAHLDEGFTRYWEHRITEAWIERHGEPHLFGLTNAPIASSRTRGGRLLDVPQAQVTRPAWLLADRSFGTQIYARQAMLFTTVERRYGPDQVDALFQAWYQRWRFGHPRSEDLLDLVREQTSGELQDFLVEALTRPEFPDYRIEEAKSKKWKTPLGRVAGPDGPILVNPEERAEHTEARLGLDPAALEADGNVAVQVRSPGIVEGDQIESGNVTRQLVTPTEGEGGSDDEDDFWASEATLHGPGWTTIPVEVRFVFDDDVVLDLPWDGRARWQTWRFLRPAKLVYVRIDPERTLALEGPVHNNALLLEPDEEPMTPFAGWLTRVAQWAMANAGMWL